MQDANNAAYTSEFLGLHVDLPYYQFGPGVRKTYAVNLLALTGDALAFSGRFTFYILLN